MSLKIKILLYVIISNLTIFPQNNPVWQSLPNAPIREYGKFEDLYFVNEDIGWVVGRGQSLDRGAIFKTSNGGKTWVDQSITANSYWRSVGFIDEHTGWIGNLQPQTNDLLYKTTDGGVTWNVDTNVPDSSLSGVCGIWVHNDTTVYACGTWSNNAGLLKTTDKGESWRYIDLKPYAKGAVDLLFFTSDTGFVVGVDITGLFAVVLSTHDGGDSWEIKHTSTHANEWAWKISYPSRTTGYVSLQTFRNNIYFLKSVDGGNTWTDMPLNIQQDFAPSGIGFITETKGWQGTHPLSGLYIIETTDGGENWSINPTAVNVNKFRILNDTLAYACGETVYKYTSTSISTVKNNPSIIPSEYHLAQNFPNPFNPLTTVIFKTPNAGYAKFEVYNVKGELVETMIDDYLNAGEYEIHIHSKEWSSGVYFYQLTIIDPRSESGGFVETKKMILAK